MTMARKLATKEDYAHAVCLFLAEGLRTRDIDLVRAAEIAQKVVAHMNLLDSEHDFLSLIKELSKDFEELFELEKRIHLYIQSDNRTKMEERVKDFVIETLHKDAHMALQIMQEATKEKVSEEELKKKFPQFGQFLQENKN